MHPGTGRHPNPAGTRTAKAAVTLLSSLLMTACVGDVGQLVSVEPAPAPAAVSFVLTDRSLFYGLTVATCRGRAMWTISDEQLVDSPARIIYGITPPGFISRTGPAALKPGCYVVTVSGPSHARFHIGADGRIGGRIAGNDDLHGLRRDRAWRRRRLLSAVRCRAPAAWRGGGSALGNRATWRGLARRLYDACEASARARGFRRFELMDTLPGVPLYPALGFAGIEAVDVPMPGGLVLPCIRMGRRL